TGLSAEAGDDGAVGRGNRVNGLITPNRPMTLEAAAGKNPVSHIGKIYSLFSFELSHKIYENFGLENQVRMVGRIGNELKDPVLVSVKTGRKVEKEKKKEMSKFIEGEVDGIGRMTKDIIDGKYQIC
ncbi:MAG: methionine adenosyltransferase, partial [Candidatus Parvarchaeota archaeon]